MNNRVYFEWDSFTWARSRDVWDRVLSEFNNSEGTIALEIGGRNGGLSLYLASEFHLRVICSDISEKYLVNAKQLHHKMGVSKLISYSDINVLNINFYFKISRFTIRNCDNLE